MSRRNPRGGIMHIIRRHKRQLRKLIRRREDARKRARRLELRRRFFAWLNGEEIEE